MYQETFETIQMIGLITFISSIIISLLILILYVVKSPYQELNNEPQHIMQINKNLWQYK